MSKNLFRLIPSALCACIACVFAVSAQAGSVTLDFDAVSDGAIVSDGTSSTGIYSGISISALNTGGGPNLAVAYDSGGAIGRDSDLEENRYGSNFTNGATGTGGFTGFGNLLIVQENSNNCGSGTCSQPDDEGGGGFLRFAFDRAHVLESFDYFDVDGSPDQQAESIAVKLFTADGFDWSDSANGTDVLLLDEPYEGLAPVIVKEIERNLEQIKALGMMTIIVEQNAIAALHLADGAIILEMGQVVFDGKAQEVLDDADMRQQYLAI